MARGRHLRSVAAGGNWPNRLDPFLADRIEPVVEVDAGVAVGDEKLQPVAQANFALGRAEVEASVLVSAPGVLGPPQADVLRPEAAEIRMIDSETLIGRWVSPPSAAWLSNSRLQKALSGYLEPGRERFAFYYILRRA